MTHLPSPRDASDTSQHVAHVENLTKSYGLRHSSVSALNRVSLGLHRGEFTAIMGPSGSGKSTLMHIMAGLDSPTSGRAWLGTTDVTALGDTELTLLRRRRVGFVFQSFNLVPTLDVEANILLPFELDGRRPTPTERAWIDDLIISLGLTNRLRHRPHELSGGQQQRVAIARALGTRPELVFADEPTGNLDSRSGREVLALLRTACGQYGQSIAMVTHDPIAASYADRIVFLRMGPWWKNGAGQRLKRSAPLCSRWSVPDAAGPCARSCLKRLGSGAQFRLRGRPFASQQCYSRGCRRR